MTVVELKYRNATYPTLSKYRTRLGTLRVPGSVGPRVQIVLPATNAHSSSASKATS